VSSDRFGFVLAVDLTGRRVVVAGSGPELMLRARALAEAGADVEVVSSSVRAGEVPLGQPGRVHLSARAFRPEDLDGAWLVVAAGTEEEVSAIADAARARRVWCHAVDRPLLASVAMPAVVRRGRVVAAVGTGGASPAMAAWLRDRVKELLGPHVAELADLVAEARRGLLGAGVRPSVAEWRLLFSGLDDRLRAGDRAGAERLVDAWRTAVSEAPSAESTVPATNRSSAAQDRGGPGPSPSEARSAGTTSARPPLPDGGRAWATYRR
jgi:siroheme synthase-like protein